MSDDMKLIYVAAYQTDELAAAALDKLTAAHGAGEVHYNYTALVARDDDGNLTVMDKGDKGLVRGAAIGGAIGGLVGLVLGPIAVATAAAGAAIGGLAEKLHDGGFDNTRLDALGTALKANRGVVLVSVNVDDSSAVKAMLTSTNPQYLEDGLNQQVIEEITASS
jgi:uncharacterized membrane protein